MGWIVRLVRLSGPAVFLGGLVALALGFLENQATLSLFVILPVVTATGPWSILGIVLMITGFLLFFLTGSVPLESPPSTTPASPPSVAPTPSSPPSSRRWGGVVFLGPIPVVFGSDPKVTQWMLILGVALFVALLVLTVIALRGI